MRGSTTDRQAWDSQNTLQVQAAGVLSLSNVVVLYSMESNLMQKLQLGQAICPRRVINPPHVCPSSYSTFSIAYSTLQVVMWLSGSNAQARVWHQEGGEM